MNIYDMLDFIRKNDGSAGNAYTYTADFLMRQHTRGTLETEDLFNQLRELMIMIVTSISYEKEE